jgi:hypothetical protein
VLFVDVVWRGSPKGLTSSLECPVFAPSIALTTSSLWLWLWVRSSRLGRVVFRLGLGCVRVGFALVVSVLVRFSVD